MSRARDIFVQLRRDIIQLKLQPGDRLSEADTAKRFGVSRQPVREAFIQLAALGLIRVTPQRPTVVVEISVKAANNAMFVRAALEEAVVQKAIESHDTFLLRDLNMVIEAQALASETEDDEKFYTLDDAFHQRICEAANAAYVWQLIDEHKAQMDRIRYLGLRFDQKRAIKGHKEILAAIADKDKKRAVAAIKSHLATFDDFVAKLQEQRPEIFGDVEIAAYGIQTSHSRHALI